MKTLKAPRKDKSYIFKKNWWER